MRKSNIGAVRRPFKLRAGESETKPILRTRGLWVGEIGEEVRKVA